MSGPSRQGDRAADERARVDSDYACAVTIRVTSRTRSPPSSRGIARALGIALTLCPGKGVGGGYAFKQYLRDIRKHGYHHKVLIRSDGEHAMGDLLKKVSELRASETVLETSPAGDSRANGRAERAVQAIEKQVRVLKLAVERNLGRFSVRHVCFPWLIMHAADRLTNFDPGADGCTAYERIEGRVYSGVMFEFARCILFKVHSKVQGGNMEARWEKGLWLGMRFASEEHIVSNAQGQVARCAAVRPHPKLEYDSAFFDALVGVPWDTDGKGAKDAPEELPQDLPRVAVPHFQEAEIPQARDDDHQKLSLLIQASVIHRAAASVI